MKKSLIAVALASLSLSTAYAEPRNEGMYLTSLDVYYGDLNLKNRGGAETALGRIKRAASDVCGGAPDSMLDLTSHRLFKTCMRVAVNDAVKQLKAPLVTALHTDEPMVESRFARVP